MPAHEPVETKNLDTYGDPPLPWSRARDVLDAVDPGETLTWFLGTVRKDGRPHAAGVGAMWHDGELYFVSGPDTQKSRDLAANPASTVSVRLDGIDLARQALAHPAQDGISGRRGARLAARVVAHHVVDVAPPAQQRHLVAKGSATRQ